MTANTRPAPLVEKPAGLHYAVKFVSHRESPEAKEVCPVFKMNLLHRRMLKHPSEGKRPAQADRCWH